MGKRLIPKTRIGAKKEKQRSVVRNIWITLSKRLTIVFALILFGSSFALASTQVGMTKPLILQSSEVMWQELPPLADESTVPPEAKFLSQISSPATPQNPQVSIGKVLLNQ